LKVGHAPTSVRVLGLNDPPGRVDDAGVGADLFHAVSSLGGLLKSGIGGAIGRFGFKAVAKPKPSDYGTVIVFVIGGVTPGRALQSSP